MSRLIDTEVFIMAKSTRHKIRHHNDEAVKAIEDCMYHLRSMDALASGRSSIIDQGLPPLVTMLDQMKEFIVAFGKRL